MSTRGTRPARRRTEDGSAFILALIVILLLTILGLSVVMVAETEMLLGTAEKTVERQQYAAETGFWSLVAGLIVNGSWTKERLALFEPPDTGFDIPNKTLGYAIDTTSVRMLLDGCPAYTDCGEDLGDEQYKSYYVLAGSTAQRVGWPSTWPHPWQNAGDNRFEYDTGVDVLGEATVGVGFFISPLKKPSVTDMIDAIDQPAGFATPAAPVVP